MHTTLKSLVFLKSLVLITLLIGATGAVAQTASGQNAGASPRLLTPQNSTLVLIDHQPQMAFVAQSMDTQLLINSVTGLAKAAKMFNVPTILTTVASKTFSGPIFPTVQAVYPGQVPIDRTTMNTWEDRRVVERVQQARRKKVVSYDVHGQIAPDQGAVFMEVAFLDVVVVALTAHEAGKECPVCLRIIGVSERREGHAAELVGAVAQHLLELPITFERSTL
jgi:hypothetical protein